MLPPYIRFSECVECRPHGYIRQGIFVDRAAVIDFELMKVRPGFDFVLFFRALADRTRLRLLNLIGDSEVCVCYFVDILKTSQPKISRHLAYLRDAGIVSARRDGKWMHYRIAELEDATAKRLLAEVLEQLKGEEAMRAERAKLEKI